MKFIFKGISFNISYLTFIFLIFCYFIGIINNTLMVFIALIFHEAAHILAARKFGIKVTDIDIFPFGGVVKTDKKMGINPYEEIFISIAGPFINFIIVILALLVNSINEEIKVFPDNLIISNIILATLNLIPAYPLDGGRLLKSLLSIKYSYNKANNVVYWIGKLLAWGMLILSLISLYIGNYIDVFFIFGISLILLLQKKETDFDLYNHIHSLSRKKKKIRQKKLIQSKCLIVAENTLIKEILEYLDSDDIFVFIIVDCNLAYKGFVLENNIIETLIESGINSVVKDCLKN